MTHDECRARWKAIADYVKAVPGRTCQDAMIEFDLSAPTVRDACYLHDVELPRKNAAGEPETQVGKITVKAMTLIARLLDETLTIKDITAEFEMTTQAVYDAMGRARKAGIRFPSRGQKQETTHE